MNLFFKRDKTIVLCGSWMGNSFSDNSRFLYQYLHFNKDKYEIKRVIWVTRNECLFKELSDKGYEIYMMHSIKSYYYHLKAGVHIICNVPYKTKKLKGDILGELSLGAKKVQLWHGIPLKGLKIDDNKKGIRKLLKNNYIYNHYIRTGGGWDDFKLLSTSEFLNKYYTTIFNIEKEDIVISIQPRNTKVLDYLEEEYCVIKQFKNYSKVILYAPTFREYSNKRIPHPLENKELLNFVIDHNIVWIEKKHLADKKESKVNYSNLKSNFIRLSGKFDLNTIVPEIDILITDYSSISFDALYFNKLIFYYIPDIEYYMEYERGFTLDFYKYTNGQYCYNAEDLLESVKGNNIIDLNNQGIINQLYDNSDNMDDLILKVLR